MKRIPVNLKLTNYDDALSASAGVVSPDEIGAVELAGFADTQRYGLFLPQCVITRLGLHPVRNAYHPEATAHSAIFEVKVSLLGREGIFYCLAAPDDEPAVIGRLPLYALGLEPNPEQGSLRVMPSWEYIRI